MKNIFIALFILFSTLVYSQKEANIWYFGKFAGLDFNSGSPVAITNGKLNTTEGCATISDSLGNLLFYTDGITVWNKNHQIMLNGTGLKGHASSTHSAIIVPKPQSPNIYYIFTVDQYGDPNGFRYSKVDITLDGGLGAIDTSEKNIFMLSDLVTEKLTAVNHSNNTDYWVVSHKFESDEFIAFKITNSGINSTPVVSKAGFYIGGSVARAIGAIKISPNGKKLAVARGGWNTYLSTDVQIFDFNNTTGKITNPMTISPYDPFLKLHYYGIEFSPNSNLLYVQSGFYNSFSDVDYFIDQYVVSGTEADVLSSKTEIYNVKNREVSALQLAIDGKIYIATYLRTSLDALNKPNELGLNCDYQFDAVSLNGRYSHLGLPPFIQSFFKIDNFVYENVCLGDATKFTLTDTVDSAVWDFGDVTSGVNNTSTALAPTHVFSNPGDYEVSVSATVGTATATTTSTVTIYEAPTATNITEIKICDTNNDGFYAVDLTLQNAAILNGQDPLVFSVKYYTGLTNYNNDVEISTPSTYTNQTAYTLEIIYAKVYNINNESCFDSTNFTIQVFETPLPSTTILPLTSCDNTSVGTNNDGIILVDLTQKETDILNGQAASDFTIEYYSDAGYSAQIVNPTSFKNTTNPQTIYVKMLNSLNNSCVATTSFPIEVFIVPTATQPTDIKTCDTDNDGFFSIDLTTQNSAILNGEDPLIFNVKYYAGFTNYTNETEITTPNSYTNQTAFTSETIYTKVYNIHSESCFDSTSFTIQVFETPLPSTTISPLTACDNTSVGTNNDGIILVDLTQKETDILNGQAVSDFTIEYYSDAGYSAQIVNPSTFQNTINPQKVYVKMFNSNNTNCVATTSFSVEVFELPTITSPAVLKQCDDNTDGFSAFNLTEVENEISTNATNETFTYYKSYIGAPKT